MRSTTRSHLPSRRLTAGCNHSRRDRSSRPSPGCIPRSSCSARSCRALTPTPNAAWPTSGAAATDRHRDRDGRSRPATLLDLPGCATGTSSSRPQRGSCWPTSARSRRTSVGSTAPPASRSPPGTEPRAGSLAELVGGRSEITHSDQGHSFQAFYEFLLSESRQQELTELLNRVAALDEVEADRRMRGIHHDWSEAAERAQRTVRQISEQLRRFLDDQVWMENRRVLDLVRDVESAALEVRDRPPDDRTRDGRAGHRDHAALRAPAVQPPGRLRGGEPASRRRPKRSIPTCCSPRPSSTRPASPTTSAPCCRNARPRCCPTSSRCIPSSRERRRSSATLRSMTATSQSRWTTPRDRLEYDDPADPRHARRARLPKVTVRRR